MAFMVDNASAPKIRKLNNNYYYIRIDPDFISPPEKGETMDDQLMRVARELCLKTEDELLDMVFNSENKCIIRYE